MLKQLTLTTLLASAFLLSLPTFGQPSTAPKSDSTKTQADVRALASELARATVTFDVPSLEKLLAEDFIDINPSGTISTREQFIDEYKRTTSETNKFIAAEFDTRGSQVRFYGDVAVLTGKSTWQVRIPNGATFSATLVSSLVAIKKNGQWLIASVHSSSLPPQQEN